MKIAGLVSGTLRARASCSKALHGISWKGNSVAPAGASEISLRSASPRVEHPGLFSDAPCRGSNSESTPQSARRVAVRLEKTGSHHQGTKAPRNSQTFVSWWFGGKTISLGGRAARAKCRKIVTGDRGGSRVKIAGLVSGDSANSAALLFKSLAWDLAGGATRRRRDLTTKSRRHQEIRKPLCLGGETIPNLEIRSGHVLRRQHCSARLSRPVGAFGGNYGLESRDPGPTLCSDPGCRISPESGLEKNRAGREEPPDLPQEWWARRGEKVGIGTA